MRLPGPARARAVDTDKLMRRLAYWRSGQEDEMKALQVPVIVLPILAAACAQQAPDAPPYRAATDPAAQAGPIALKSFDDVFDAQYVRRASLTPETARR